MNLPSHRCYLERSRNTALLLHINGDFIEFNAEIKLSSYICSNGHITPRREEDR
jgi:hypothetical protein